MKTTTKYTILILVFFIICPLIVDALTLKDLYTMADKDRAWYMGGVYDANLSSWNDKGVTSNCLEKMAFEGFMLKMSEFITSLPEDENSKERQLYDNLNAAAVAWIIIQKECTSKVK